MEFDDLLILSEAEMQDIQSELNNAGLTRRFTDGLQGLFEWFLYGVYIE
jgi:hypothetical protein